VFFSFYFHPIVNLPHPSSIIDRSTHSTPSTVPKTPKESKTPKAPSSRGRPVVAEAEEVSAVSSEYRHVLSAYMRISASSVLLLTRLCFLRL